MLAVAAAFLVGFVVARPTEPGYGQAVALHRPLGGSHVGPGTVAVRPVDHGTEVRLDVSGLPATTGTWYECMWWSDDRESRSAGTFRSAPVAATQVELTAAAALHPGWRLAILEQPPDSARRSPSCRPRPDRAHPGGRSTTPSHPASRCAWWAARAAVDGTVAPTTIALEGRILLAVPGTALCLLARS